MSEHGFTPKVLHGPTYRYRKSLCLSAGVVDSDPFALLCLQIGKKPLLPVELHSILDGLNRHLGYNEEARLSEAWPCTFYRLVYIVLQSNRIAKIHGIATTIFQLDLRIEPSFQRGFKSGSLIKAFWEYDPWTAWRLHHLNSCTGCSTTCLSSSIYLSKLMGSAGMSS